MTTSSSTSASTSATTTSAPICGLDILAMAADMLSKKESSAAPFTFGSGEGHTFTGPFGRYDINRPHNSPTKSRAADSAVAPNAASAPAKENAPVGNVRADDAKIALTPMPASSAPTPSTSKNVVVSRGRVIPPSNRVLRSRTKRVIDKVEETAIPPPPAKKRRTTRSSPSSKRGRNVKKAKKVVDYDDELEGLQPVRCKLAPGTKLKNRRPVGEHESWECQVCGAPFYGRPSDLRRHELSHNKNPALRPWACPVEGCDLTSNQSGNVKTHIKNVHMSETRKCNLTWTDSRTGISVGRCSFTCHTERKMKVHMCLPHVQDSE